ncbi:extracellular solute-binding protein [Candidatus Gracilibacteria bacterium]|nr:extracellular solute-binding protein [Candidatus Gracilibacteria bacterium]
MKHRPFAFVALIAIMALLLAACGAGTQGTSTEPTAGAGDTTAPTAAGDTASPTAAPSDVEPTAAPTAALGETQATAPAAGGETAAGELDFSTLEVESGARLRFAAAGNTTEQQLYQQATDRFNEAFADRDVQMTFEPVPSEYETSITAGFSGGNAPDVFLLNGQLMGQLAPQGVLLALDDTMAAVGRNADDFYLPLLELYQYEGATYGLPKDFNPLVLFINTQLAEQAGVIERAAQDHAGDVAHVDHEVGERQAAGHVVEIERVMKARLRLGQRTGDPHGDIEGLGEHTIVGRKAELDVDQ